LIIKLLMHDVAANLFIEDLVTVGPQGISTWIYQFLAFVLPSSQERMCRWLLMVHGRAEGESLPYTHEFLANILGANRKSVTLAAQSMQLAGLISYHGGTIQVLNRQDIEKASCECSVIVRERFDAFLKPPETVVQDNSKAPSRNN
jgi:hypothetical protein